VLQWLVENTPEAVSAAAAAHQTQSATNNSNDSNQLHAMTAERRQFLEQALAGMGMQRDYLAALKEALKLLTSNESSDADKADALETISYECEDMNVAGDFSKLGAMPPLLNCLQSNNPELMWRAADVVASLTQNCPEGLQQARDNNLFAYLRPLLIHPDEKVRLKALRAISCLIRSGDDKPVDSSSASQDTAWVADVVASVRQPGARVQVKAVHLLRHICGASERFSTAALDADLLSVLSSALLADEDMQLWEQGLHLLVDLSQTRNSLLSELEHEHPALLRAMTARRSSLSQLPSDDKDAHREELEHMTTLLGLMQT